MSGSLTAYFKLGPAHTIKPQAKVLVTTGIYKKIRHPIYFFSLLTWIGFALLIRSPGLMLMCNVILFIQVLRAKKEEEVLVKEFKEQYLEYKKGTWF